MVALKRRCPTSINPLARGSRLGSHHGDWPPGLHRRLGADVAPADGAMVVVPGSEAVNTVAIDGPEPLASAADKPDPWGVWRQRDARFERWWHDVALDSVVLD